MQVPRDANQITALLGVLNTDGKTTIAILADSSAHSLHVSDAITGSDNGPQNAKRDDNQVTSLIATSSQTITVNGINYIQGVTPVVVYADSSGNLLIDSM